MTHVVFVGSNPSEKSTTNTAFEPGTKSMDTLLEWVQKAGLTDTPKSHGNISSIKTPGNRPLNKKEIEEGIKQLLISLQVKRATHVVALGKTAAGALAKYGIPHLEMPHPSGLNRKLNDPKYVEYCLDRLRSYCCNGPGLNEVTLDWQR